MSGDVRLEIADGVATVTLAREHRRNALDARFASETRDALATARAEGARTAVLLSSIPVFSAGVDLSGPIRQDPGSPDLVVAAALLDAAPYVVTAIEGPTLAGGLQFAALSPIVVAGAQARFWLPERSIGLFPGRVLAYLEQVVPARSAHWLGVTEQRVGADEARDLGLVSVVVPAGEAAARTRPRCFPRRRPAGFRRRGARGVAGPLPLAGFRGAPPRAGRPARDEPRSRRRVT